MTIGAAAFSLGIFDGGGNAPDATVTGKLNAAPSSAAADFPEEVAPPAAPLDPMAEEPVQAPTEAAPAEEPALPPAPTEAPPPTPTAPPPAPTQAPPPPAPTEPPPPPPPASVSLTAMESAMFADHNAERAAAGRPALALDARLVAIARERAANMAQMNCFSHTACGPDPFQLLAANGYAYSTAGENIARNNYPDSQSEDVAMTGFMNSPGHRANILEPRFTKVGIGVAVGADGMKYFAVVFAG